MTTTDLVLPPEIANPLTGELVPVGDIPRVAAVMTAIREARDNLNDTLALCTAAVVEESRRAGTRTLSYGSLTLEVSADTELEWDVTVLVKLLKAGLPQERYDQLVTEVVSFKVNGTVARSVSAANPKFKRIVERAKSYTPRRQYVKVRQP